MKPVNQARETCRTCRFAVSMQFPVPRPWGSWLPTQFVDGLQCHRRPPTLAQHNGDWPTVEVDDWCGEYRPQS